MFLFQFALIPISLALGGTIPLVSKRGSAIPVVSVTVGARSPVDHKVFLGHKNVNHVSERVPQHLRERIMRSFSAPCRFSGSDISITIQRRIWQVTDDGQSGGDWLAIGPGSELVTAFGSIDFVRTDNGSRLILGAPEDRFVADHCQPGGSLVRIPTVAIPQGVNQFDDWMALGSMRTDGQEALNGLFVFSDKENVLEMGFSRFSHMFAELGNAGHFITQRIQNVPRLVVPVCTDDIMRQFPNITLSFFAIDEYRNVGGEAGRVVLSPSDYILPRPNGSCWMSIGLSEFEGDISSIAANIHLNPLLLPYINTRSSADGLILACRRPSDV
jgi:hypothetical protein